MYQLHNKYYFINLLNIFIYHFIETNNKKIFQIYKLIKYKLINIKIFDENFCCIFIGNRDIYMDKKILWWIRSYCLHSLASAFPFLLGRITLQHKRRAGDGFLRTVRACFLWSNYIRQNKIHLVFCFCFCDGICNKV